MAIRWASLVLLLAVLSIVGLRAQTAPGAPTIGTASAISRAVVAFTAPASDGGSPITVYTATSSPGGITGTGTRSPIYVTGLTGGTSYTFTVTATNAVGTSSASAASNSVTPSSTLIPADSAVNWAYAGAGGIPARATQCGPTILASSYGNGTIDASADITAAIAACPVEQHVLLGPGTFLTNTAVNIKKAVTLRGSGVGVTLLKRSLTTGAEPVIILGNKFTSPDETTAVNLTADGVKGTSAITVTNATGFAAGQYVLLDEDDFNTGAYQPMPPGNLEPFYVFRTDRLVWALRIPAQPDDCPVEKCPGYFSRFGRPLAEIKEVASVSGNTITFTTPIHITYQTAKVAQVTRYTGTANIHISGMGVENLSTIGGNNGNIRFSGAVKSWAKNVEVAYFLQPGILVVESARIEIRDSYIHESRSRVPGSGGYLMTFMNASSDVLVENNIFVTGNKVMTAQSAGAGSVLGYNYLDNSQITYNTVWAEVGLNGSHFIGPHHMLFEGNQSNNYDSDDTHGNSIYQTVFRNHFTGQRRDHIDASNVRTIGLESGSFWQTFVGNVLGTPALPPAGGGGTGSNPMAWVYEDPGDGTYGSGASQPWGMSRNPAIWRLGYWTGLYRTEPDPQVLSTVVRERNWDYFTDSVISDRVTPSFLPDSLYLSAKPPFFETADTWPWVNPTGATKVYTLPAKRRYEAIAALPGGAGYSYTQGQYHHLTPAAPTHTFTTNNTAGRSIIVGAGWTGTTVPTISDTRGNTYTLVQHTTDATFSAAIWAAHGITAGANTVTLTHATSDIDAIFTEYAGLTATDKSAGRAGIGSIPTSGGTDPTTTANQMVFGFVLADVSPTYTPAASSTMNARALGGGAAYTVAAEDKRTNLAGTYEADFTHTNNIAADRQNWIALAATFKESAGSPVVPSAPSIGTATAGVQQATVSFIGSASDGGSAITSYTVTSSPGGLTATGAGSPLTVTGLTAGTPYTFTVRATNAIGQGPASAASNSVTPTGATGYAHVQSLYGHAVSGATAVTINVTAGNMLTIAATWDSATAATIALSQGTAPGLRRHQVSGSTSTAIWSAFARPAGSTTVTLTLAGATFDVIVAEYSGLQSAAQRSIGASGTGGTPSSGAAAVTTTANAMVFGVARHDGTMPTAGSGFTLRGSGSTGTVYLATEDRRVTATGTYAADFGATAAAWMAVVNVVGEATQTDTTDPVVTITTPATPTVNVSTTPYPTISGTASDAVGVVSCLWTNAAGGNGAATGTTTWSISDVALSLGANLITVVCLDAAGNDGTDTVTINYNTVAGPPVIGTATAGNAQATVTFTPPGADGGSAITGYTATSAPGGLTATGAASPLTVTGLTNGTPYSFTVTATNAVGVSLPSASSNQVTPVTVPGPPTIGTATAGTSTASVAFTPPASDGGSVITVYTATSSPGSFTGTAGASPIAVEGLAPATGYTFTVTATNAIGTSAASAASNSVTLAAPSEQRTLTADIYHLAPGPCFIRSGEGAPSGSLGGICDTYYRTDTPFTVYRKTASGTWMGMTAGAGGATPYTPGDLIIANSATDLGRVAPVAPGSVLRSNGTAAAPAWTANPSLTSIGGAANLTLSPAGDLILGPAGNDILPSVGYTKNIGSLTNKFLTLHAAELWVETLVAQNTIATIGGRVLVGPTTVLSDDLTGVATSITVKHNQLAIADIVHLEAEAKFERMRVTGGPSGIAGSYVYTVTRNLDGSGANSWTAGDAVFNTGVTGDGFIDLYSASSVIGSSVLGPTVAGLVRTGTNHNDLEPRWAIGNMNGLYGYGQNIYGAGFGDGKQTPTGPWLKIDANSAETGGGGIRAGAAGTTYFTIDPTGNAWFSGNLTVGTGGRNMLANSEFMRGRGTGDKDGSYWGGIASVSNPGGAFTCPAPCSVNRNMPLTDGEDDGSTGFDNSTGLSMTMNVNLPGQFPINGGALFWTMGNGQTPPVGTYSRAWGPKIPVAPGQRYEFSFYAGVHRGGQLTARLIWFLASGVIISETDGSVASSSCNGLTGLGGTNLSDYCRVWNISNAPVDAAYVIPTIFQLYDTTSAPLGPQPYTFVTRAYFGIAQEGQLQPSPWGPAGHTLITGEMLSTDLVIANTMRSPGVLAFDIGTGYWVDAANTPPTFRVGDPLGNRLSWDGTNLTIGQGSLSIGPNGIQILPGTSATYSTATAYGYTVPNGDMGMFGWDASGVARNIQMRTNWTGPGNRPVSSNLTANFAGTAFTVAAASVGAEASSNLGTVTISTSQNNVLGAGRLILFAAPDFQNDGTITAAAGSRTLPGNPCGFIIAVYQQDTANPIRIPFYAAAGGSCPTVP